MPIGWPGGAGSGASPWGGLGVVLPSRGSGPVTRAKQLVRARRQPGALACVVAAVATGKVTLLRC